MELLNDIVVLLFFLATLIQLFYWLAIFSKLARYKSPTPSNNSKQQPVSVIICAKNEAINLKKNLPHILNQNYPNFEVIVVNDNSTDETGTILLEFQKKFSILHIVSRKSNDNDKVGKKFALSEGIKNANNEVLLLTDADCKPISPNWIQSMQDSIDNKKSVGLGYSPYYMEKGWLNIFIRYETIYTAIQYLSFALWGKPYMGVGRNLIYKKSLYDKVDGFKSHEHIASGDDDLFINAIAHLDNTTVIVNKSSFVYSDPKKDWKSFSRQKARHLTTGTSYQFKHQVLLGLLSSSHITHYFLGTFTFLLGSYTLAIGVYLARMSIIMLVGRSIFRRLDGRDLFVWIPVLDAMMVTYYVLFAPALAWGAKNRW